MFKGECHLQYVEVIYYHLSPIIFNSPSNDGLDRRHDIVITCPRIWLIVTLNMTNKIIIYPSYKLTYKK